MGIALYHKYLDAKAGHLHPQTVSEGLQPPFGDTIRPHVQAVKEGEDAGHEDHPTCSKEPIHEVGLLDH